MADRVKQAQAATGSGGVVEPMPVQTPVQNTPTPPAPPTVPTPPVNPPAPVQTPVAEAPVTQPAAQQTPVQQATAAPQAVPQAAPRQTTYIGPDGGQQTGYNINGTTYTDAAGTTPVGVGSIVTTADGKVWIKTANGSMPYADYLAQGRPGGVYSASTSVSASGPQIAPLEKNIPDWQAMLNEWRTAAQQQSANKIDYAVQKGVNDLQRAEEDAQQQFQEQRDQIAATEAVSKDNQALYAERRGDRGGIGAAQYDSIMNTAAQNQLKVNQAQTKLSTDTARQIADLRAQGEFQKADDLLQIAQTYLSQLISLQQWAAEYGLSIDQFNKELEKWGYNYAIQVANLTGDFNGQRTLQGQQYDFNQAAEMAGLTGYFNGEPTLAYRSQMAEFGWNMAQSGTEPGPEQREALRQLYGVTDAQIDEAIQTAQLAKQAALYGGGSSRSSGGGGGGSLSGPGSSEGSGVPESDKWDTVEDWVRRFGEDAAEDYIKEHYKDLGYSAQSAALSGWLNHLLLKEEQASSSSPAAAPIVKPGQMQTDSGTGTAGAAKETVNTVNFLRSVAGHISRGEEEEAGEEITRLWPKLTAAQRKTLKEQVLDKHGYVYTYPG